MVAKKNTAKVDASQQTAPQRIIIENEPEKSLIKWKAKARSFKRRDREFWVSIIAIASVVGFVLFIIEGVISVILVISIVFLFYVLSTVEPGDIEYEITNESVIIGGEKNPMEAFVWFWFGKSFGNEVLALGAVNMPGRLDLVIDPKDKEKIRKVLSPYLIEQEKSPSRIDRAADWLSKKIPSNK